MPYKDRERQRESVKIWSRKAREWLERYKSENPCHDCGNYYPWYVMEFDHVRGVKARNISKMATNKPEVVLAEIEKCDLVCSNCHAIRTFRRSSFRSS